MGGKLLSKEQQNDKIAEFSTEIVQTEKNGITSLKWFKKTPRYI